MDIIIHTSGMPFNGETIDNGESLGGSESAAYYMAKELARLGHTVTVFSNIPRGTMLGVWAGVRYEEIGNVTKDTPLGDRFEYAMTSPRDVLIIQRHPAGFINKFNTKLNIWWLHDLALHRQTPYVNASAINIDQIFTVSEYHKQQVHDVYNLPLDKILASANGVVDLSKYVKPFEGREPMTLLYAARPERGLENLVGKGGIMEKLPECRLYVCGYDNTTPQMADYYNYLWSRCKELDNVENMGALSKSQLHELMGRTMLYVYPTTFEETSCINVMEAQACGLPIVGTRAGALPETLNRGGAILNKLKDGKVDLDKFATTVRSLLNDKSRWIQNHRTCLNIDNSWNAVAWQWDRFFNEELARKSDNDARMIKHYERYSDIVAMRHSFTDDEIKAVLPDFEDNYDFLINDTFPEHYKALYEYEKTRGVEYGQETLKDQRFRAVLDNVRWTIEQLEKDGFDSDKIHVLDYGCAHGHYVMNLAPHFPEVEFFGIDIDQSNIDTAEKWAKESGIDNVQFSCGEHTDVFGHYHIMLINEVLEHVTQPNSIVRHLADYVDKGGWMICTVPYGPWEAIGYNKPELKGWRAHIHHLEREDLKHMFGQQTNYKALAIPTMPDFGHIMVSFQPDKPELIQPMDFEAKRVRQVPRQTLSVCIIAKDAEYTLGKTLQTVADIADEIIIGMDITTRHPQATERIAGDFGAKLIFISTAIDIGFDEARNLTIKEATMDWIMWLDSDETLENPHAVPAYLRDNVYNGYCVPQHHMAAEPPSCFQTDYPVRLFRNRIGVTFFGHVHEHPEITINEGVGKAINVKGFSIMHTGYSTEVIRRKRFERNFPMMKIDREKYPERILGKFLYMRDLSHYVQYTLELNGSAMTPELMARASEGVKMWQELLNSGADIRLVMDGLPFMSFMVQVLTQNGGIDFAINCGASRTNGGAKLEEAPKVGRFMSSKDIKKITERIVEAKVNNYEDKYY